ncbi:hypothetical protein HN51_007954 [Arachis hypogaea]
MIEEKDNRNLRQSLQSRPQIDHSDNDNYNTGEVEVLLPVIGMLLQFSPQEDQGHTLQINSLSAVEEPLVAKAKCGNWEIDKRLLKIGERIASRSCGDL